MTYGSFKARNTVFSIYLAFNRKRPYLSIEPAQLGDRRGLVS